MVDVITANNMLVNSQIFPGHLTRSTFNVADIRTKVGTRFCGG